MIFVYICICIVHSFEGHHSYSTNIYSARMGPIYMHSYGFSVRYAGKVSQNIFWNFLPSILHRFPVVLTTSLNKSYCVSKSMWTMN